MDNNTAKFLADMLEENQNIFVELLCDTKGRYDSEQLRVEAMVRKLRKEAETPK